ncbi:MAG: amidohydrolase [Synergistaceae bacterium]|nr:amidohydrolase [Synergistaceae bacterium]
MILIKILFNGIIRTGVPGQGTAQAVAFEEGSPGRPGRIVAVGGDSDISALGGPGTERIDLGGRLLLPGFIDSHMHMAVTGHHMEQLKLNGVKSRGELVARARAYIEEKRLPEGEWLEGIGFNQEEFDVPDMPDAALADEISRNHPIILIRQCYHVAVANSAAISKIDPSSGYPGAERDASGRLTGVFRERGMGLLFGLRPAPSRGEIERRILSAAEKAVRTGLTSVHSIDLVRNADRESTLGVFQSLAREGRLPLRVCEGFSPHSPEFLSEFLEREEWRTPTPFFKLGFVKLVADGSLGARSACLREPYSDAPETRGKANFTQEELEAYVSAAHAAGRQIAVHAIGDAALEQVLRAMEKIEKSAAGPLSVRGLRHRVVHMMTGDLSQYERAGRLGLCADIQPAFLLHHFTMSGRLGPRTETAYAWKTLLDLGISLGGGSDSPIDTFDPLFGIYCAVTRQDRNGSPEGGHTPGQRLTVEEAVKLYTSGSARLAFEENEKGTVEPGKLADFAVLTRDIFTVPPREILETRAAMTWVDGKLAFLDLESS